VRRWVATFLSVFVAGASVLLAVWAVGLIAAPAETIHWEHAIPALLLSALGGLIAFALWSFGKEAG
jgi:hypothetical protein